MLHVRTCVFSKLVSDEEEADINGVGVALKSWLHVGLPVNGSVPVRTATIYATLFKG